jgi:hypothetical protein
MAGADVIVLTDRLQVAIRIIVISAPAEAREEFVETVIGRAVSKGCRGRSGVNLAWPGRDVLRFSASDSIEPLTVLNLCRCTRNGGVACMLGEKTRGDPRLHRPKRRSRWTGVTGSIGQSHPPAHENGTIYYRSVQRHRVPYGEMLWPRSCGQALGATTPVCAAGDRPGGRAVTAHSDIRGRSDGYKRGYK